MKEREESSSIFVVGERIYNVKFNMNAQTWLLIHYWLFLLEYFFSSQGGPWSKRLCRPYAYGRSFTIFLDFFCMIFMLNKLFCHFLCHLLEVWGSYSWFMAKGLICPQPTLEWLNGWSHNSQLSKIRSDMLKSALWGIFETLDWLLQK